MKCWSFKMNEKNDNKINVFKLELETFISEH